MNKLEVHNNSDVICLECNKSIYFIITEKNKGIFGTKMKDIKVHISIIIPLLMKKAIFYFYTKTLLPIVERISLDYEIIFVDDVGNNGSFERIIEIR